MDKKLLKEFKKNTLKELDPNTVVNIANQVTCKIVDEFNEIDFNYIEIVKKIIDTNMYYVVVPKGMQDVNYVYEKNAIYFSDKLELVEISENVYRECIHKIQEKRNKRNRILKVGLCNFYEISAKGLALNEAAVQYIISKILRKKEEVVSVNKLKLPVHSYYYPLTTNLINQIVYLLGENTMVESTIKANDEFKYQCIDNFGELGFQTIQNNFEKIMKLTNNIGNYSKEDKIEEIKNEIKQKYFETQKLIFNSYFDKTIKKIENLDEVSKYRKKIEGYENLIGYVDNKDEYISYYKIQIENLNKKELEIKDKMALIPVNRFTKIISGLRKIFRFNKQGEKEIN